jgi:hypothetical protein
VGVSHDPGRFGGVWIRAFGRNGIEHVVVESHGNDEWSGDDGIVDVALDYPRLGVLGVGPVAPE